MARVLHTACRACAVAHKAKGYDAETFESACFPTAREGRCDVCGQTDWVMRCIFDESVRVMPKVTAQEARKDTPAMGTSWPSFGGWGATQ